MAGAPTGEHTAPAKSSPIPEHEAQFFSNLSVQAVGYAEPDDLGKFVSRLKENLKIQGQLMHPRFEIGVGAQKNRNGKTLYVLLVGDRGQFSLPSQTHALHHVDIDGDGLKDLVTGRRWWAHLARGDAAPTEPAFLFWFEGRRGKDGIMTFIPHLIDDDSGIGTQFAVNDLNGDGLLDVVVANRKGVYAFEQVRNNP